MAWELLGVEHRESFTLCSAKEGRPQATLTPPCWAASGLTPYSTLTPPSTGCFSRFRQEKKAHRKLVVFLQTLNPVASSLSSPCSLLSRLLSLRLLKG